jgi:hypothetical protein
MFVKQSAAIPQDQMNWYRLWLMRSLETTLGTSSENNDGALANPKAMNADARVCINEPSITTSSDHPAHRRLDIRRSDFADTNHHFVVR